MKDLFSQIKMIWGGLGGLQKGLIVGVGALALVGIVTATLVGTKTEMLPVGAALSSKAMMERTEALTAAGIPFEVRGADLFVPAPQAAKAHTAFGAGGITGGTDRLDSSALTDGGSLLSDKQTEAVRVRVLEDSLGADLERFEGVETAVVRVTPGRRGVSREQTTPAKASVHLTPQPGHIFQPGGVLSIVSHVGHAVEGLNAENISVTDSRGRVLAPRDDAGGANFMAAEASRSRADAMRHDVMAQVAKTFGPDKVRVQVALDMDMTRREVKKNSLDPDSKVSLNEITEVTSNTRATPGGTVSTAATQADRNTDPTMTSSTERLEGEYGYSRTEEHIITGGGIIKRMTVGIMVDESLSESTDQIQTFVENAVGFNAARGDVVSMSLVPFAEPPAAPEPAPTPLVDSSMWEYAKWGVTGLVGLILVFFMMRSARSARLSVRTALDRIADDRAKRDRLLTKDRRRELTDDIVELVDRDADSVGKLLRGWLYEPAKV